MTNRRAMIACGVVVGAVVGATAAYYLPVLWWYYANGLSDTSGGPIGVDPVVWFAPFGAIAGAALGGLVVARRERADPRPAGPPAVSATKERDPVEVRRARLRRQFLFGYRRRDVERALAEIADRYEEALGTSDDPAAPLQTHESANRLAGRWLEPDEIRRLELPPGLLFGYRRADVHALFGAIADTLEESRFVVGRGMAPPAHSCSPIGENPFRDDRAHSSAGVHAKARRDVADPNDPGETGGTPSFQPGPDRLPRIVLALTLATLTIAGVAAVFVLGSLTSSHGAAPSADAAPTSAGSPSKVMPQPRQRLLYAGLTRDRATKFAASDLATLLGTTGSSGSEGSAIVTTGSELGRTRCFHSGHWKPYWRVSFAGGSPVFESRPQALLFCNRNSHVIEVTAPIHH